MSEEKNRKIHQAVKAGDVGLAPKLAIEGARSKNPTMIYDGIVNSLNILSRDELGKLQLAIAKQIIKMMEITSLIDLIQQRHFNSICLILAK